MGEVLARVGKLAFMEVTNFLYRGLVGAGHAFAAYLAGAVKGLLILLSHATTGQFWSGLGDSIMAAASKFLALLQRGLAVVLDKLADIPGLGDKASGAARQLRGSADANDEGAKAYAEGAGASLAPLFKEFSDNMARTLGELAKSFGEGAAGAGDLFDVAGAKAEFMAMMKPIMGRTQEAMDRAQKAAKQGGLPGPPDLTGDEEGGRAKGNDVASIQHIGGGGGFSISRADPLIAATRGVKAEAAKNGEKLDKIHKALTERRPSASGAVFG